MGRGSVHTTENSPLISHIFCEHLCNSNNIIIIIIIVIALIIVITSMTFCVCGTMLYAFHAQALNTSSEVNDASPVSQMGKLRLR